jgi:hypothetical protein
LIRRTLETDPDVYIDQIASKDPAFQTVFQVMNLKFRHEGYRLQQSFQRLENSSKPNISLSMEKYD